MANRYFSEKYVKNHFDEVMDYATNGDYIIITNSVGVPTVVMVPLKFFEDNNKAMEFLKEHKSNS